MSEATRLEHDALGELSVPEGAYWGIHAERARQTFAISGWRADPALIRAIAWIKRAAARSFAQLGRIPPESADAIERAARELEEGRWDDQVVVEVFQAGAGTSLHMNLNEVIANRANELLGQPLGSYRPVHPNDTVNMGQSTNDVVPTAMRLACLALLAELDGALAELQAAYEERSQAHWAVIKAGRTHLQDAAPLRLGQELGAAATAIARSRASLAATREGLWELGLGGTAVGTGLNAPTAYRAEAIAQLRVLTGWPQLHGARDMFEAMESMGVFTTLSGALRTLAIELGRLANDLRLLASGPHAGLAELELPAVQAGSSIMPGKVNPSVAEMVNQVAFQVLGCDATVAAASQAGQLELNVMMPVIAHNLLVELRLLKRASEVFARRCVRGIQADEARCAAFAQASPAIAAALNPLFGYQQAAAIAQEAARTDRTVAEVVRARGLLTEAQIAVMLTPLVLTEPAG